MVSRVLDLVPDPLKASTCDTRRIARVAGQLPRSGEHGRMPPVDDVRRLEEARQRLDSHGGHRRNSMSGSCANDTEYGTGTLRVAQGIRSPGGYSMSIEADAVETRTVGP